MYSTVYFACPFSHPRQLNSCYECPALCLLTILPIHSCSAPFYSTTGLYFNACRISRDMKLFKLPKAALKRYTVRLLSSSRNWIGKQSDKPETFVAIKSERHIEIHLAFLIQKATPERAIVCSSCQEENYLH